MNGSRKQTPHPLNMFAIKCFPSSYVTARRRKLSDVIKRWDDKIKDSLFNQLRAWLERNWGHLRIIAVLQKHHLILLSLKILLLTRVMTSYRFDSLTFNLIFSLFLHDFKNRDCYWLRKNMSSDISAVLLFRHLKKGRNFVVLEIGEQRIWGTKLYSCSIDKATLKSV